MLNFLKGKKTYILGVLMFLTALEKYISGDTTLSQFITTTQGLYGSVGLGFMTVRAAIKKVELILAPAVAEPESDKAA